MVMAGADQPINGKTINPSWQHSGAVDWEGNVYIIERDAHRIVKLSPKMDTFLLQIGTTGEKGNDGTHLDLPSGIAVLKSGNIVVTDGYGNNRVALFGKDGTFIKQVAKGAGGFDDKGTGAGEWILPHKLAVDADENLYIIDRENKRLRRWIGGLCRDSATTERRWRLRARQTPRARHRQSQQRRQLRRLPHHPNESRRCQPLLLQAGHGR
jgi:hypothetical protein